MSHLQIRKIEGGAIVMERRPSLSVSTYKRRKSGGVQYFGGIEKITGEREKRCHITAGGLPRGSHSGGNIECRERSKRIRR